MRRRRAASMFVLLALTLAVPAAARNARTPNAERRLSLHTDLPRDPLIVLGMWLEDPAGALQGLGGLVERFTLESSDDGTAPVSVLGKLDPELGTMIQTQILSRLGPELALVVDLPPIDDAVARLQFSKDEALAALLGRSGVVARVIDGPGLDEVLRGWILSSGGKLTELEGLTEAVVPTGFDSEEGPLYLRLFYAVREERMALGFSQDWVRAALDKRRKGERLIDGDDFKTVFARLDSRPSDLVYVNLPRLRELVLGSQVLRMVLQANPELGQLDNRFLSGESLTVGLGATSVRMADGVRTTNFGPPWMSGTAVSGGYIAALALPSLLASVDKGKTRRTVTDLESIARACEGFSTDSRTYPGPTDGWVPVEKIATYLEPVYIGRLPRTDGWNNPILYWSDGGSYRILSTGRDGLIERDWTGPVDTAGNAASDIVFGDGQLLVWPAALGE